MKYRKKPIVVEAYQTDHEIDVKTLEGTMHASVGDYIITGVNGEIYPCKPDIFEKTYELAKTRIKDLTFKDIIEQCNSNLGCQNCPLNKEVDFGLFVKLCRLPIESVIELEVENNEK